jgi:hypothetical protein
VIIMFAKWFLHIAIVSLLITMNAFQAINTITISVLSITIYRDGTYDLEAIINTTGYFNHTLTLHGRYVYNEVFEVKTLQKPVSYNGKYKLVFLFKKSGQETYNGSIYEENTYNDSFYIRKANYLLIYGHGYINVSRLNLEIETNNARYILYWNLTITALKLIIIDGQIHIQYRKSNNNYTLHVVMTENVYPLDKTTKEQLSKAIFPGENYLSPWVLMGRINLISHNMSVDRGELLLSIKYAFKGLGLIIERGRYMIPLAIILGKNGFEIVKIPIGLVNNTLYTSIVWNTTINNNKLYSRIYGKGYGLSINGMDRVKSIIDMVKKLFLKNSDNIMIRGGDFKFSINGTITDQIDKIELKEVNIKKLQYVTETTENTTEYKNRDLFSLILFSVSLSGLILSFILYRFLIHRMKSET